MYKRQIQSLSENVIVPIAGLVITYVLCVELISMVTEKNNTVSYTHLIMRVRQGVGEPNRIYVLIPGKEDAALA